MKYIVGGYAASPCLDGFDPSLEARFWSALRSMDAIRGLEIPFYEHLHRFDELFLLNNLLPEWSNVITLIPGTIERFEKDPAFGLASNDERGRNDAVAYVEKARQSLLRLNRHMKRKAVLGVEIHSAPRKTPAQQTSKLAFARSLSECASWDWDGAQLLVEHCDAFVQGQVPSKGFLTLEDELDVLRALGQTKTPVGVLINWARSVIEGRSADRALQHVRSAKQAGFLKALIFSGCAETDPNHGGWQDSHAPFSLKDAPRFGAEGSLLTKERAAACVDAGDWRNLILGFKIQPLPKDRSLEERIGLVEESLRTVDDCLFQRR